MRPRNRKVNLAKAGAVILAAAGVAAALWPERAAEMTKIAQALAALFAAVAAAIAYDDGQQAQAAAHVEAAKHYAAAAKVNTDVAS